MHLPLVTILTFLPALGALLLLLVPENGGTVLATPSGDRSRMLALAVSGLAFLLAVGLWIGFVPGRPGQPGGFQFEDRAAWMSGFGVSYHLGLDGISLLLVVLTTFITPVAILATWGAKGPVGLRPRDYMIALLLLESTVIGLYASLDFVLFYVFYEATLIPASILIGLWGGPKRTGAAIKFFLFTFGSSLFMLLSILAMWRLAGTTDVPTLLHSHFAPAVQLWMFLGLAFAFGVKLPLFPLHGWLPDTYTEGATSTVVVMAAVLGKAGGYGFLRFAIAMLPDAAHRAAPVLLWLGIIGVIYAAAVALAQTDMKRLLAYSSFSHMGLVLVGLFTLNAAGMDGALFTMLSHGVIVSAMFLTVSMLSGRAGERTVGGFGGVARRMPALGALAMVFAMANIGLPGTGSFVGELLVMIGAIRVGFWVALFSGSAMILGAVYMLVMYRRVMFEAVSGVVEGLRDLSGRELAVLAPLAVVTLWMGIYPGSFTRVFDPAVTAIATPLPVADTPAPQAAASTSKLAARA